ncbi:hypothetical protein HELRODRAFT_160775 [Helobdella robusta]|uniref:Uncharacterized protein n=1 Tax=Helobdella robusta TaxID=6412 RepID=T1EQP8_HELRO|nr:hypothetical protein HELRODRAFT_160775 [Helobdella robusta]ESO06588.1 hypothetical protein HELRODRAFT_160775 [Helobdella robusta]
MTTVRKKDVSQHTAQIVVRINNLIQTRDNIEVIFPNDRDEPLIVRLNGKELCNKILPGPIIQSDCKYSVHYGDKGDIKIKLKKSEPCDWMKRWSPTRETRPPSSFGSDVGSESLTSPSLSHSSVSEHSDKVNHTLAIKEL